jgi:hypothetical protein
MLVPKSLEDMAPWKQFQQPILGVQALDIVSPTLPTLV